MHDKQEKRKGKKVKDCEAKYEKSNARNISVNTFKVMREERD